MPTPEKPVDPVGDFDSDAHREASMNARFPTRPDDKTQWWIEGDRLCIPNPDGMTIKNCTREYVEDVLSQHNDLLDKVRDLEQEANRSNPSRFLPEALRAIDSFGFAAIKADDRPRSEAYANAGAIIRGFIGEEKERDRGRRY